MAKNPNILIGAKLKDLETIEDELQKDISKLSKNLNLEINTIDIKDIDQVTNKIQSQLNQIFSQINLNLNNIKVGNIDSVVNDLNSQVKKNLNGENIKIDTNTSDLKNVSNSFDDILSKAKQGTREFTLLNGELAKMNTILDKDNKVTSTTLTYQIDSAKQVVEKYGWKVRETNEESAQSFELVSRKIIDNKAKLESGMVSQDKYLTNLENKLNRIKELSIKGERTNENYNSSKDLESVANLQEKINELKSKNVKISQEEKNTLSQTITELNNLVQKETSYAQEVNKTSKFLENQIQTLEHLKVRTENRGSGNKTEQSRITEELNKQINKYQELISRNEILGNVEMNRIVKSTNSMKNQTNELTRYESTFANIFNRMKDYAIGGSLIYGGISAAKQGLQDIIELDTAMRELKKVSNETSNTYSEFENRANQTAIKIGATTQDMIQAAADWKQAGESFSNSEKLAEISTIFQNVGDISQKSASNGLITTMKSFNIEAEKSIGIVDKINQVSNQYAVSANSINESLKRSASSLSMSGNNLSQSIGLITSADEIIRDSSKTGNALKSISMNIRKVKEDANGATPAYQKMVKSITNGKVSLLDANGQFKSTYDIIKSLGEVFGELDSKQKSLLAQSLAGKQQANVFYALMQNYQKLDDVYKTAENSAGSAAREQEQYMDSLAGKINALKENAKGIFLDFGNTELIKGAISGINGLITGVRKLIQTFGGLPTVIGLSVSALTIFNDKFREKLKDNLVYIQKFEDSFKKSSTINGLKEKISSTETKVSDLKKEFEKGSISAATYQGKMTGLKTSLSGLRIALDATKIAARLFEGALTGGISLLLSFGIEKIISGFSSLQKSIHMTSGQLKEFNNDFMNSAQQSTETVEKAEDTFNKIQKTQSQLLNTKDKNQQVDLGKQLVELQGRMAEILPKTANGYDKEKKAIATNNAKIAEQIRLKKEEMKNDAISFAQKNKNSQKEIQNYANQVKEYKKMQQEISSGANINRKQPHTGNALYDSTRMPQKMDTSDLDKMNKKLEETMEKADGVRKAIANMKSAGLSNNDINSYFGYDAVKAMDDFDKSLVDVNKSSEEAKEGVKDFGKATDDTGDSVEDTKKKIQDLSSEFGKLRGEIGIIKEAMKEFQKTGKLSADTVEKILGTGDTKLIASLGDANTMLSVMKGRLGEVSQEKDNALKSAIQSAQEEVQNDQMVANNHAQAESFKTNATVQGTTDRTNAEVTSASNKMSIYGNDVNNHGNSENVKSQNSAMASGDRVNSTNNEVENKAGIYGNDVNNHSGAEKNKVDNTNNANRSIVSANGNLIAGLGKGYATDSQNWSNLMTSKLRSTADFVSQASKMLNSLVEGEKKTVAGIDIGKHTDYRLASMALDVESKTKETKKKIDSCFTDKNFKADTSYVPISDSYSGNSYNPVGTYEPSHYSPSHSGGGGGSSHKYKPSKSKGGSSYKPKKYSSKGGSSSGNTVDIKDIEDKIDRYKSLQDTLDDVNNEIAIQSALEEDSMGVDKLKYINKEIDLYKDKSKAIDDLIEAKKKEGKELEDTLSKNGFNVKDGDISNYKERLEQIKNNVNAMSNSNKSKEKAIDDYKKLKEQADRYFEVTSSELPNLRKEWIEVNKAMKDNYRKRLDIMSGAEKDMTDVIKNQIEKRKKSYEDETDKYKEELQKKKDAFDNQFDKENSEKELKEKQEALNKINAEIDSVRRDDSASGQARLQELLEKQKDISKELNEFMRDKQKDSMDKMFDDEMDDLDKKLDEKNKHLEETYTESKITELAKGMIQKGFIEIEGHVVKLKDAINDYYEDQGELFANSSLKMQEFIDKLEETKKLYEELNDINKSLGVKDENIIVNEGKNVIPPIITSNLMALPNIPNEKNKHSNNVTVKSDLHIGTVNEANKTDVKKMLDENNNKILKVVKDELSRY